MGSRRPTRLGRRAQRRSRQARRRGARRWLSRRRLAVALPIALVLLAGLSATVMARSARDRSPNAAALRAERHTAAREAREAARRVRIEALAAHPKSHKTRRKFPRRKGHKGHGPERENAIVTSTCTLINWTFRRFPDMPNNRLMQRLTIGHYASVFKRVVFDGPGTFVTTPMNAPIGKSRIDTGARWRMNGAAGAFDIHSRKVCPPNPAFTIEKLQKISGPFTKSPLRGSVGQTVQYEIIVRNTGNVPLDFSNFSDPHCDAGTIAGGPTGPLTQRAIPENGETATYTCSHVLTSTELYENNATATATPPLGSGGPITHTSNTVIVNGPFSPEPAFTIEKLQRISGAFTTAPLTGEAGQTVSYEIVVKNTGNTPLTFSSFIDEHCDPGTVEGGPGSKALEPGEPSTYTCSHGLTIADAAAGSYSNHAADTGTPPEGSPITHTSNTVVVNLSTQTPEPAFTITKLQKIEGSFTGSPLTGKVGQTVGYEMIVTNTGNTSLTFSNFSDEHCDAGTIAGGPSKALEPGESSTYTCSHVLTSADQTAGSYSNTATVTATPPGSSPITHTSNTVVVNVPTEQKTAPVVYVGYVDGATHPTPWKGSNGVTFVGCGFGGSDRCPQSNGADVYDAGAIRVEATAGSGAVAVTGANVVIGPCKYEPWPGLNATIQPGQSLVLTQTGKHQCTAISTAERDNFDTSESFLKSPQYQTFLKTKTCSSDGYVPAITLTINGTTTTLNDSGQVLNTGGTDPDICRGLSEATNWVALPSSSAQRAAKIFGCNTASARRALHRRHRGRTARAVSASPCPTSIR